MKAMHRLLKLIFPFKGLALLNMIFNLIQIVAGLFSLALIMPLLDFMFNNNKEIIEKSMKPNGFNAYYQGFLNWMTELVQNDRETALFYICLALVVATILKNIARYLALYFLVILRNKVIQNIRESIFNKILRLPISYFSNEKKGDLMSRMSNDVKEVEWSLMASLEAIFKEPATILIYIFSLVMMSPKLTLFVVALLPVAAGSIALLGRSLRRKSKRNQEQQSLVLSFLEESIGGIRIIKAFVAEKTFFGRFSNINQEATVANIKVSHRGDLASPISETMGIGVAAIILWFGGNMVFEGTLTSSTFLAYFAIFSQVIPPFKQLSQAFPMVQRGAASMDRYEAILTADEKILEQINAQKINRFETEIEFKNIKFSYANEPVLKNISFKIPKNKKVALVGASGSGKSTIADLLPRFYDAQEGEILIDGKSNKDFIIDDLRALMGIVTQEAILFNDTIANNITFGLQNITQTMLENAAQQANALEFITATEKGFDTIIGERGSKLSGGQRQRIAIARALLRNPQILILDEATSALDNESEKMVQSALDNLKNGRTTLVIAHRLSTIMDSDEIIVLEKGEIIERGTHATLIAKQGAYFKLHQLTQSF